jgi:hypothetical protein
MSVAAFAGQSFNNTNDANPRTTNERRTYTKVPEATLNATLRDIHDFVQYAVVEAQRILFGEDLSKTLAVSINKMGKVKGCANMTRLLLVPLHSIGLSKSFHHSD